MLVPESEYLALINLLKGGVGDGADSLQNEKAVLDARIQRNLNDHKMDADVKMKRHSWLYKQRHQIKDMIDNKPQKVIVENASGSTLPNIAPYMGIQKAATPNKHLLDEVEDGKKTSPLKKRRRSIKTHNRVVATNTSNGASYGEETDAYTSAPETDLLLSKKREQKFLKLKTDPVHYDKLQSIIERNPAKYGVHKESPASYAGIQKVLAEAQRRNPSITLRDVHQFLHKQRTYTLFKPRKNRFRRLKTVPSGLHTDWQCDLCIMDALREHNDGFRYILVCIDVLSRKIFTAEAESKKSEHMIAAFEKIFKKAGVLPNKLYSDAGLEFQAKKMTDYWKQKDIIKHVMYSPHLHAGVVERANRTLKERLYKYFSEKNTKRWIDVLDSIVRNLNSSANRTTGLKPVDVNFKNANALRNRLYKQGELSSKTPKFKAGDIVRISKEKGDFSKGYFPNFTDELFRISKVNPTDPPSYRIRDQDGEDIKGIFYEQELVKTVAETTHRAEVLKTRRRKGVKEHFVRLPHTLELDSNWTVALASIIYPYSFPSVGIDEDDIISIKLVNPSYRFLDDKKFLHIELKIPSMQFSSVEHLRLTLNNLITEAYQQQISSYLDDDAKRTKRQENVTDLFFHENPVDYWEKIGELRAKYEHLEKELTEEESELSAANTTDAERKKVLESELPLKRLRTQRKKEELEELERAAERRDQESPEAEQKKIGEFFHHHPENYNRKLNEARLIFTHHLSGLQAVMRKYIDEKDTNKIRQLDSEVEKLRPKIKRLQRNLTIFENATLQRDHQKSLSQYEELSHQQNSAYVKEFFQKHPTNYWQIIHNNYRGLTEHFQKIEELRAKAVGLKDNASFQQQIERAKQLIEYRRKRFAALEFEAKKLDEQKQLDPNTIPEAPTASALVGRESLKKRTGISSIVNTDGGDHDQADEGPQATTTPGEALRDKLLQKQKQSDHDDDDDTPDEGTQTTTKTHGDALKEKILKKQKHADNDDDKTGDVPQIQTTTSTKTTKITKTHGEALREKVLQKHTDVSKPTASDAEHETSDVGGGGEKMTHGQTLIARLKQSEEQKKEWVAVPQDDDDDDRPALKHGDMLWKLLRSTTPPNKKQTAGDVIHRQFADAEHTRGQVMMELLKNILEEKSDAADAHRQQQQNYPRQKSAQVLRTKSRGEALKELIKKTQNEQLPQSSAKTRGEILKLMLEHMKFSREEEVSFEKLVAKQKMEQTATEFVFNDLAQRFVLKTGAGVLHVDVSKHLAYVLGFDNIRLFHGEQARYMPDLSGGVKQLYVYAPKLIEECIIGDRMAPLLRVVNVSAAPASGGGTDVPETKIILKNSSNKMTHVAFNPDTINWAPLLALQQEGRGEMQYFVGTRHQRGAGLLKNVARFLMPVASNMLKAMSREGVSAGSRIMEDLSQGKALKESIQAHTKQGMENLAEKLKQCGKGAPTRKRKRPLKRVKTAVPMHLLRGNKRQAIDQLTFAP
ncbi:hypothetical protein niasHT_031145 [Heterodera trifolii]|uniref:Integrase catalytic domain-containing protein n=1 Tax=Heterodera trifolii TaxID=157864 RepID=A0ABD2IS30_9BILA